MRPLLVEREAIMVGTERNLRTMLWFLSATAPNRTEPNRRLGSDWSVNRRPQWM